MHGDNMRTMLEEDWGDVGKLQASQETQDYRMAGLGTRLSWSIRAKHLVVTRHSDLD